MERRREWRKERREAWWGERERGREDRKRREGKRKGGRRDIYVTRTGSLLSFGIPGSFL